MEERRETAETNHAYDEENKYTENHRDLDNRHSLGFVVTTTTTESVEEDENQEQQRRRLQGDGFGSYAVITRETTEEVENNSRQNSQSELRHVGYDDERQGTGRYGDNNMGGAYTVTTTETVEEEYDSRRNSMQGNGRSPWESSGQGLGNDPRGMGGYMITRTETTEEEEEYGANQRRGRFGGSQTGSLNQSGSQLAVQHEAYQQGAPLQLAGEPQGGPGYDLDLLRRSPSLNSQNRGLMGLGLYLVFMVNIYINYL